MIDSPDSLIAKVKAAALDYKDIALHVGVAVGAALLMGGMHLPFWMAPAAAAVVFPVREAIQADAKYDGKRLWPWQWSKQKLLEAFAPVPAALAAAVYAAA